MASSVPAMPTPARTTSRPRTGAMPAAAGTTAARTATLRIYGRGASQNENYRNNKKSVFKHK